MRSWTEMDAVGVSWNVSDAVSHRAGRLGTSSRQNMKVSRFNSA